MKKVTIKFDYSKIERGHEFGKGRGPKIHKHKTQRRAKDKLRKELSSW